MPRTQWSNKRERQYQHIKAGLLERGRKEDTAEELSLIHISEPTRPY